MGGFLNTLGAIGKGIVANSGPGRMMNRYGRHQQPQMMGPHPNQPQSQTDQDIANMQAIPPEPGSMPPQPNAPMGEDSGPLGYENAAKGVLVTKPTIARVGESGPEAIVPLNNAAGNKVRPDLMEGHLQPPKVPGVRYQNFKGYIKPSY
jgi:hypothetical protein